MLQFYGALAILTIITVIQSTTAELRFVNVVFRHGDRAPQTRESFPNDENRDNDLFPMGPGGLTNEGKRKEYELGKKLRNRYNEFLGDVYIPKDVLTRSTDFDRTKMSLALVLAGLYPPSTVQKWNSDLNWQPIPISYVPLADDAMLMTELCLWYVKEFERVQLLPEVVHRLEHFRPLMDNLTIHTGKTIRTTHDMYLLYHYLAAQKAVDLKLPEWAHDIFPNGELLAGTLLHYDIMNYNDLLKRLLGGILLKRFTDDMVATVNGTARQAEKINLFSTHETNVASFLNNLGVYQPHVPEYSSAVIVELHEKAGDYYVKVLYYLGTPPLITELTIPGCDILCPLEKFIKIMKNVTAQHEDLDCPRIAPINP